MEKEGGDKHACSQSWSIVAVIKLKNQRTSLNSHHLIKYQVRNEKSRCPGQQAPLILPCEPPSRMTSLKFFPALRFDGVGKALSIAYHNQSCNMKICVYYDSLQKIEMLRPGERKMLFQKRKVELLPDRLKKEQWKAQPKARKI